MSDLTDNDIDRVMRRLQSATEDAQTLITQLHQDKDKAERTLKRDAWAQKAFLQLLHESDVKPNSSDLIDAHNRWEERHDEAERRAEQAEAETTKMALDLYGEMQRAAKAEADAAHYRNALENLFNAVPTELMVPEHGSALAAACHVACEMLDKGQPEPQGEDGDDIEPDTAEQSADSLAAMVDAQRDELHEVHKAREQAESSEQALAMTLRRVAGCIDNGNSQGGRQLAMNKLYEREGRGNDVKSSERPSKSSERDIAEGRDVVLRRVLDQALAHFDPQIDSTAMPTIFEALGRENVVRLSDHLMHALMRAGYAQPGQEAVGEWIIWPFGMCPVPFDTEVCVKKRDGTTDSNDAGFFNWGESGDIFAYKVLKKRPAPKDPPRPAGHNPVA